MCVDIIYVDLGHEYMLSLQIRGGARNSLD